MAACAVKLTVVSAPDGNENRGLSSRLPLSVEASRLTSDFLPKDFLDIQARHQRIKNIDELATRTRTLRNKLNSYLGWDFNISDDYRFWNCFGFRYSNLAKANPLCRSLSTGLASDVGLTEENNMPIVSGRTVPRGEYWGG
jgi:hypothetical protein